MSIKVAQWGETYENSDTRKRKTLFWVLVPNRHDTRGFCKLMRREDGLEVFGAWNILLQLASRCSVRGELAGSNGEAYSAEDVANMTRTDPDKITNAIDVLTEIGWLHSDDLPPHSDDLPPHSDDLPPHSDDLPQGAEARKKEREERKKERTPLTPQGGEEEGGGMPEALRSETFLATWARWKTYLIEKKRPLVPTQQAAQLESLAALGSIAATESLLSAMMRGWQSPARVDPVRGAQKSIDHDVELASMKRHDEKLRKQIEEATR